MSYHTFEIYPECNNQNNKPLYYVEFTRWSEKDPLRWRLFKRQYMYPDDEWQKIVKSRGIHDAFLLSGNEVHPWNLMDGEVNEHENAIRMNTKSFLKFMVDALNEKVEKPSA